MMWKRRQIRTEWEQHMYSWKLIKRVRSLGRAKSTDPSVRAIRLAADRILVNSNKRKTHWNRAMLKRQQLKKKYITRPDRKSKKARALQRKVRVLSRLVPGCRNLSLSSLLEETTDYIGALEMQVKAMTQLTQLTAFINVAPILPTSTAD